MTSLPIINCGDFVIIDGYLFYIDEYGDPLSVFVDEVGIYYVDPITKGLTKFVGDDEQKAWKALRRYEKYQSK